MPWIILLLFVLVAPANAQPSCFGAAAMEDRCHGYREPPTVTPSISYASKKDWGLGILRNGHLCRGPQRLDGAVHVCRLGDKRGGKTVALIGDSHSASWRPAFDRAAKRRHWQALSLVEPGCEYNLLDRLRYGFANQTACRAWRADLPRFLTKYHQIDTVFLAQYSYLEPRSQEVASYQAAWRLLPLSVKNIIVIRDNPRSDPDNYQCIAQAIAADKPPGLTCAQPRRLVLTPDWAAEAARDFPERNGRVVDVSDSFCSKKLCYPVIGGALVYAEGNHQTPTFNRTLTTAFLRAYASAE